MVTCRTYVTSDKPHREWLKRECQIRNLNEKSARISRADISLFEASLKVGGTGAVCSTSFYLLQLPFRYSEDHTFIAAIVSFGSQFRHR